MRTPEKVWVAHDAYRKYVGTCFVVIGSLGQCILVLHRDTKMQTTSKKIFFHVCYLLFSVLFMYPHLKSKF